MTTATTSLPDSIEEAQTTEETFLRQIFVRDQMSEFTKQPIVMARADGVCYWDVHGKRYLDAISGIYVVSVGHNNRRVIDAIKKQLDVLAFSPPMHGTNPQAVQLANLLAELAPGRPFDGQVSVRRCRGRRGGDQAGAAVPQAYRLAGKVQDHQPLPVVAWLDAGRAFGLGPQVAQDGQRANGPGFIHVFPPTCYRCPFGKTYPDCGITCATIVEDVIGMEDPSTVAAIIVEPIGHTGGVIDPPEEYLPILREICDRHNILLIFDEIITGIGRTGKMFAAETFGVTPDVLLTAKGLSGGYAPLSAMICRRPIADAFWGPIATNPGFVEGHTFEGNPISCAAGLAVLREILERDLLANARQARRAAAGRLRCAGGQVSGDRRRSRQGAVPGDRVCQRPGDESTISRRDGVWRAGRTACAFAWPLVPFRSPLDRLWTAPGFNRRRDRRNGRDPRSQPG